MYARDVSRRRSPLSLSPLQVKTAAEKKEEEEEERRGRDEQEQERSSPVRAICIQRPCCRERGEVAINNATHHQYLAGITARTPIYIYTYTYTHINIYIYISRWNDEREA